MPAGPSQHPSVAVLIPCLDEERGISAVVAEFRRELPDARIVVVDNGSTDATARAWSALLAGKGFLGAATFHELEVAGAAVAADKVWLRRDEGSVKARA